MTAVDLYAGAGGMSLGLHRAGFHILKAYDLDPAATEIYNRNIGYSAERADLFDVAVIAVPIAAMRPHMIVGCPPCQDFSSAGSRTEGVRANHTRIFALYVCATSPEWFLMENVQRAKKSAAWRDAKALLARAGYGISEVVVDASFYGVPQRRKRLIVVGRRGERDGFMNSAIQQAASPAPMTLRQLFGNKIGDHVYNHPRAADRRGVWSVDEPGPTVRNARRPQPKTYQPHPNDSNYTEALYFRPYYSGRGVYGLDEPAPTVLTTSRERPRQSYLANPHPSDPIPAGKATILSQSHVSSIQGFPHTWDWSGQRSKDIDQMIANAVPPPLAERIGRVIIQRHLGQSRPETPGSFTRWLARERQMPPQVIANVKWRVNRARQMLGGRDLRCRGAEARALEVAMTREGLSAGTKSDIRRAIATFRDWQEKQR